jgi:hypothetical protein
MFSHYTVKQLKQILHEAKDYHNIKYCNLSKAQLISELEKRFVIDGGNLYSIVEPLLGGNAKNAGYVRRMEAENKIDFPKIHNPSKYMINKYGNQHVVEYHPEPIHHEPAPHDAYLFAEHENFDFNVGKEKPKKTKVNKQPTKVQEDREREARQNELERKKKVLDEYELLKKQLVEFNKKLQQENNDYYKKLEELRKRKDITKVKKLDVQEEIIVEHVGTIKKIKEGYAKVFQYMKTHKLNESDLNGTHKTYQCANEEVVNLF